jgi:hypothetical protein
MLTCTYTIYSPCISWLLKTLNTLFFFWNTTLCFFVQVKACYLLIVWDASTSIDQIDGLFEMHQHPLIRSMELKRQRYHPLINTLCAKAYSVPGKPVQPNACVQSLFVCPSYCLHVAVTDLISKLQVPRRSSSPFPPAPSAPPSPLQGLLLYMDVWLEEGIHQVDIA